ncbi:MAG: histidine kinase, partial [Firmicutes bacterium]|nr:histidine kinase [Bacillota bacterium]
AAQRKFAFLLAFGLRLSSQYLSTTSFWSRFFKWLPFLVMLFWYVNFITFRLLVFGNDLEGWFDASDIWSRYLMAFPGSILTALGLHWQAQEFQLLGYPRVPANFRWAALVFSLYAVVSGLVVPEASFFPASLVNHGAFFALFRVPVQIFRAFCGLTVAFFVIRGMEIFDLENRRRLEETERRQAMLLERVKVGRDLHDGLLQDIYGLSLRLEHVAALLENSPARAREEINSILKNLAGMVKSLRHYIVGLHPDNWNNPDALENSLNDLAAEFRAAGMTVDLYLQPSLANSMKREVAQELWQIAREALSNVRKHALATRVEICLRSEGEAILFYVRDNGIGFSPGREENRGHQGLANMRSRATHLGTELELRTAPGRGTEIRLLLPARSTPACSQ